jgi:hypothetical protein
MRPAADNQSTAVASHSCTTGYYIGRREALLHGGIVAQKLHPAVKIFMQRVEPEFYIPRDHKIFLPRDRFKILVGLLLDLACQHVDL